MKRPSFERAARLALIGMLGCAPPSTPRPTPPPAPTTAVEPQAQSAVDHTPPMVEPVDEAPRQQPPETGPGGRLAMPSPFGALGQCRLSGVPRRGPIRVDPASGAPFLVQIGGLPIDVTMGKGAGASSRVASTGAIRFEGSARELVLSLRKPLTAHEGMLRAPRGARVVADGEQPDGSVRVLTSIDIPLDAPCEALALGAREPPEAEINQRLPIVVPVDEAPLTLASSPRAEPTLPLPEGLVFTRLAGGVDFVKIVHRGWDGVTVTGYLPAPRLAESSLPAVGVGRMGCGCAARGFAIARRGVDDPYAGPARLRDGTLIHGERDGGVWARVVGGPDVLVTWKGHGDPWVRVDTLPGVDDVANNPCLCAQMTHAFVLRDAVAFSF